MAKLDDETLEQAAVAYLAHYASSRENLRRVLMRRIARAGLAGAEAAAARQRIAAIVARAVAARLLDDGAYAVTLAAGLSRRGVSASGIRFRLVEKGVAANDIAAALAALGDGEASELAAACALVRRRRLGPLRPVGKRDQFRDRDLGALARAGFDLGLARRVLAAADRDALDRLAQPTP